MKDRFVFQCIFVVKSKSKPFDSSLRQRGNNFYALSPCSHIGSFISDFQELEIELLTLR